MYVVIAAFFQSPTHKSFLLGTYLFFVLLPVFHVCRFSQGKALILSKFLSNFCPSAWTALNPPISKLNRILCAIS